MSDQERKPYKPADLSRVDIKEFLTMLQVKNITYEDDGNFRYSCPHQEHAFGDKTPSAYMKSGSTAYVCFSCGRTGNAITFLADVMEVSRATARRWIEEKWSPRNIDIEDLTAFLTSRMNEAVEEGLVDYEEQTIDEGHFEDRRVNWELMEQLKLNGQIEDVPGWADYMLSRGLTPETLNRFDACYDKISDRPCITVRNSSGDLVGFKGRAWRESQFPKYMVLGDTERTIHERGDVFMFAPYDASRFVFGLDKIAPAVRTLVAIEGELNVMMLRQFGVENVCGPSGSTFSAAQVQQIIERCEEVILFMDYDVGDSTKESMALVKIYKAMDLFEPYVSVKVVQRHSGDPMTMDRQRALKLIEEAMPAMKMRLLDKFGLTLPPEALSS